MVGNSVWAVSERSVWHSADGGLAWAEQRTPPVVGLRAIAFADSHSGCAVGPSGTAIHTEDGGATWTEQVSGVNDDRASAGTG